MDPSLNQSSPVVEEDDWGTPLLFAGGFVVLSLDTDGFVIPSLVISDSDLANTNVPGVTGPKPPANTTREAETIYLGPHGAPPQARQQESNASSHRQRFKHKLREADGRFPGTGRKNKVETLQQLVGSKVSSRGMLKTSPRDMAGSTLQ